MTIDELLGLLDMQEEILRRKPNQFEPDAWLGLLYYFMHFHCIYTLKCSFQSAGRFIATRLTTPLLF